MGISLHSTHLQPSLSDAAALAVFFLILIFWIDRQPQCNYQPRNETFVCSHPPQQASTSQFAWPSMRIAARLHLLPTQEAPDSVCGLAHRKSLHWPCYVGKSPPFFRASVIYSITFPLFNIRHSLSIISNLIHCRQSVVSPILSAISPFRQLMKQIPMVTPTPPSWAQS